MKRSGNRKNCISQNATTNQNTWDCFGPFERIDSEFLKGATVQSRKHFQRLRKIWVFKDKNAQFTMVLPFCGNFSHF